MSGIGHVARSAATDPLASLQFAIALAFGLVIVSERLWWIHFPLGLFFLLVSIAFQQQRSFAFDSFLVGLISYPAVCRDIPNQALVFRVGILWFAGFSLMAAVLRAAAGG